MKRAPGRVIASERAGRSPVDPNVKHFVICLRNPHASTEKTLLELEYIIDQLADFYAPNEARQWMFAPQKLLAGESPANLIRTGRIDEVMRLVGQLRDAVHF